MRIAKCVLALAVAASCSTERAPGSLFGPVDAGDLVVDALLIVDRPMPPILVSRTIPPGVPITDENSGIPGAHVEIRQGARSFLYRNDGRTRALYLPPPEAGNVLPETRYEITIRAEGRELRGETVTPPRFRVREAVLLDEGSLQVMRALKTYADGEEAVFSAPENQVVYQDGLLEARFDAVAVPGYQVGIISLDPGSDFVIEADFLDPEDYEDFERQGSSPAFEAKDGTLRLPWFAIYYAGRHKIRIYAVDRNWFDFARTSPEFGGEGGFGGLAGDSFRTPQYNVTGGIGLFGSAAVDSVGFVVLPKR